MKFRNPTNEEVRRMQKIAGILKEDSIDLKSMLEDYMDYKYTADQGFGESAEHAEAKLLELADKITAQKGKEWFDTFDELSSLTVVYQEYAGPEEVEKIEEEMKELANKLGSPVTDLISSM